MIQKISSYKKVAGNCLSFFSIIFLAYIIVAPNSFVHDKIDPHTEFITNYGNYLQIGEVVRSLSNPNDSFFIDGFDELIYWQADRYSSFKYSWYTSVMPLIHKYSKARLDFLTYNPTDFYYGSCPKDTNSFRQMPDDIKKLYAQLYSSGKPTCLYIKKTKIPQINDKQWLRAKELLYELQKTK